MSGSQPAEALQNVWDVARNFCKHNAAQRIALPLKSLWTCVWKDLENDGQRLLSRRPSDLQHPLAHDLAGIGACLN